MKNQKIKRPTLPNRRTVGSLYALQMLPAL